MDSYMNMDGSIWRYEYTLTNNTTCFGGCGSTDGGKPISSYVLGVRQFAVPYFDDAGVMTLMAPEGWIVQIVAEDIFELGHGAQALVWSASIDDAGIAIDASLNGFAYEALFEPGKGPFSATLGNGNAMYGDPAIPLSPNAVAAGILPLNPLPEPPSYLLMLAGIAILAMARPIYGSHQVHGVA